MNHLIRVGDLISGRYRLRKVRGHGRMSTVYDAQDMRHSDDLVAIKLLDSRHPDKLRQQFFRRETESLSRLSHQNIVPLLEYNFQDIRGYNN